MGIEARPNAEASIRGNGLVLALLLGVGVRVTRLVGVTAWTIIARSFGAGLGRLALGSCSGRALLLERSQCLRS